MSERRQGLLATLRALEDELRDLSLWSAAPPSLEALASGEPFCVDTLGFDQWLQWLFIPRMADMVAAGNSVPGNCNIHAMGEEVFAHLGRRGHRLLSVLARVDAQVGRLGG